MTHDGRVWHHMYETLEGIHDLGMLEINDLLKRQQVVASLDDLLLELRAQLLNAYDEKELYEFAERMAELKMEGGQ